ncbi:MAG: HEAT repeat domain-containing protein [Elusimicrobia bacterium]|nr:HEAT repeat domain-containing protein [Elusimicrobiota bacterium]
MEKRLKAALACALAFAVWACAQAGYEELIGNTRGADGKTRVEAVRELGRLKEKRAVGRLVEMIYEEDALAAWEAVKALGQIKDPSAIGALAEVLRKNEHWDMRWAAAEALGAIGGDDAAAALEGAALDDENKKVRSAAGRALNKILGNEGRGFDEDAKSGKGAGKKKKKKTRRVDHDQMPKEIYLSVGYKKSYAGQGTKKKYGYMCAEDVKKDRAGKVIAVCCDAQTMAQVEVCAKEDPDKLTVIGVAHGSVAMKVFRALTGRTAQSYEVTVNVGTKSK